MSKTFQSVRDRLIAYRLERDLSWVELAHTISTVCEVTLSARVLHYVCTNPDITPRDRTRYKLARFIATLNDRPVPTPRRRRRAAGVEECV